MSRTIETRLRKLEADSPSRPVHYIWLDASNLYAKVVALLYPEAMRLQSSFGQSGVSPHALIHPTARLGDGVVVDPGAVVGPGAEVGAGAQIGAYTVIGPGVRIGRSCAIAASVSLSLDAFGPEASVDRPSEPTIALTSPAGQPRRNSCHHPTCG